MFVIALIVFLALGGWFVARAGDTDTYGSNLVAYIEANHPQHSGDVERLTVEFNLKQSNKQYHL